MDFNVPSSSTQQPLLDLSMAGDQAALEQLLLLHYQWLHQRVERLIPSDLQGLISADDILQETFVRVFASIQGFQPRADLSFPYWLKTIADHQVIDMIRRRRHERLTNPPPPPDSSVSIDDHLGGVAGTMYPWSAAADEQDSPLRGAILHELGQVLPLALARLPDDYRNVLRLRYLEGRALEEVAAEMGRSVDAVRGLCHRAGKQLREILVRFSFYL
jgi:RNA polymerase sigma-70 factor (ECF subfamily)